MKKKPRTKKKTIEDYRLALLRIASFGQGIKPDIIDWQNIGKMAVGEAKEALREKCLECGK